MANLTIPYRAEVTYKVKFVDQDGVVYDPTTVELHVGGQTYTFAAAQVTKTGTGLYQKTLVMSTPGRTTRIWVGEGPGNAYVESKKATINVLASNV